MSNVSGLTFWLTWAKSSFGLCKLFTCSTSLEPISQIEPNFDEEKSVSERPILHQNRDNKTIARQEK